MAEDDSRESAAENEARQRRSVMMMVGKYSGLAMVLPAAVFVGYFIGNFLDTYFGTGFLKMTLLLVGVAAGLLEVIRQLQKET